MSDNTNLADSLADSLVDSTVRRIGDAEVGPLGYGLWRFIHDDAAVAQALIESALDAGLTLIDTADVYGLGRDGSGFGSVEERLGKVLAVAPGLRDRMVLATKGGIRPPIPYDSSGSALVAACDDSLRRLGVDHVDLYQIHRPDLFAHPAEVAEALQVLHDSGKVGAVGVSNYTPSQTRALMAHLNVPLVTTQPEYSASHLGPLRDGTLDLAMERGIVPIAWSPLAGGALATGEGIRDDLVVVLDEIAWREDADRSQVALAFVLAHPSRPIAIIGTQNPDRIRHAAAAVNVRLNRADVYRIIEASEGEPLP